MDMVHRCNSHFVFKDLCLVSYTCALCPYFPSAHYTITTFPCHVVHSTAQNGCDDNICSICEYRLDGLTTYVANDFMPFLLCMFRISFKKCGGQRDGVNHITLITLWVHPTHCTRAKRNSVWEWDGVIQLQLR